MQETYVVRQFPFHRITTRKVQGKTVKSRQTYVAGDEVKLTEEEYLRHEHLLEKPETRAAREKGTAKKTTKKED